MAAGDLGGEHEFADVDEAEATIAVVMEHYNRIARELAEHLEDYAPVLEIDPNGGETLWEPWIDGFERAMRLRPDAWEEIALSDDEEPEFFIKLQQCANGPYDDIVYEPKITGKLDYETELAIVIGKGGRHIAKRAAMKHIFGFTVMNDVTARDRQVKMRPDGTSQYALGPGKNFDTSAPLGPCIVTTDELGNPQKLALRTWVNDELRQNNTTAMMIWNVRELVHFFSGFVTLKPGSVISTGTPGGTAWGTDPELGGRGAQTEREDIELAGGYLKVGDVVTCEIEGIGRLRASVVLSGHSRRKTSARSKPARDRRV